LILDAWFALSASALLSAMGLERVLGCWPNGVSMRRPPTSIRCRAEADWPATAGFHRHWRLRANRFMADQDCDLDLPQSDHGLDAVPRLQPLASSYGRPSAREPECAKPPPGYRTAELRRTPAVGDQVLRQQKGANLILRFLIS